jgi:tetratricopeptide (TPR) repeat protein
LALFRRKPEPGDEGSGDYRSKRGGVRRSTEINIDLSQLEQRAAPSADVAPQPKIGGQVVGKKRTTARVPAPRRGAAATRTSTRASGRGKQIGELLIQSGAINTEQLTKALRTQEAQGGLLGRILVQMGACSTEDIAGGLAKQVRFTNVDMTTLVPTSESLMVFSDAKCRDNKLIPFECVGQYICVAMTNVLNKKALTQVESLTKLKAKGFKSTWPAIEAALNKFYTPEIQAGVKQVEAARVEGAVPFDVAHKIAGGGGAAAPAASPTSKKRSGRMTAIKAAAKATPAKLPPDVEAQKYIDAAIELRSQNRLEDALKRLEAGAAAVPDSKKLQKVLANAREEVEKKRAKEAERFRRVADLLAQGRAARTAGNIEDALEKFQEAAKLDDKNNVIHRELAVTQKEYTRLRAEEAARKKLDEISKTVTDEEELKKAEAQIMERAEAAVEADAERRRSVAASGGESRLEVGVIDEESLVPLSETPIAVHTSLAEIVASRMGYASAEEGIRRLPGARTYARSREALRQMVEAARAAEAALEEEVLVPADGDMAFELEPGLDPQAPMPDLELQLDAEAEIVEAVAIDDDEDIVEGEIVEAIAERMDAVQISDADFAAMEADLVPDALHEWFAMHATTGPVPAAPVDDIA